MRYYPSIGKAVGAAMAHNARMAAQHAKQCAAEDYRDGQLAELRHAYCDLDADSACRTVDPNVAAHLTPKTAA